MTEYDEIRFVRVDKLPASRQLELQKLGIYDGIVKFKIKGTTPKEIVGVEQALELPSQHIQNNPIQQEYRLTRLSKKLLSAIELN